MMFLRPAHGVLAASACTAAWILLSAGCVGDPPAVPPVDSGSDAVVGDDGGVDSGTDTGTDAATADTGLIDGGADAKDTGPIDAGPRCDLTKPFDPPVNEGAVVNTAGEEDGARLSPSELELFLTKEDLVGKRIYRFNRVDTSSAWAPPVVEAELSVNPPAPPASHSLALDPTALGGYLAVFTGANWHIYLSTRSSIGGIWSTPIVVPNLSAGGTDEQPWINQAGTRIYFMSNRGGPYRIYTATKSGAFNTPVLLDSAAVPEDRWPVLSSDERTLYYAAYDGVSTSVRVYKKTRASATSTTWSAGVLEDALNGGSRSFPTSLSTDGCEIYIASNRSGGIGLHDVYHARKPR